MSLLKDDRQKYGVGAIVAKMVSKKATKSPKIKYGESYEYFSGMKNSDKFSHAETERFLKEHGYTEGSVDDLVRDGMQNYELMYGKNGEITGVIAREKVGDKIDKKVFKNPRLDKLASYMGYAEGGPVRVNKVKGGSLLEDDMPNKGLEALRKEAPEVVERMGYEEGGPMGEEPMMEEPMMDTPMINEPEEDMLPDNEMEDEYLDFILDEALDNEEEDFLMDALQGNDRLSMIFDKVIDVAQEFAGSGPVEGPGSGVSDSIPARLSDGEFVFTAKAVEEIGADNLMAMMKDAEMKADDRQGLANGGEPEERVELPVEEQKEPQVRIVKETVDSTKGLEDEDEISKGIKSKMMLDPDQRHVRS